MKKTIIFLIKRLLYTGVITLLFLLFSCSEPKENISSKSTNLIPPPVPDQNINVSEASTYGIFKMQSNNQTFLIENNECKLLIIYDIIIAGANILEFTVNTSLPITIQPEETSSFDLQCKPTATGKKEIKVMIYSDDPENDCYIFTVNAKASWVQRPVQYFYYNKKRSNSRF